ncbi:DinB family protein [Fulvivirga maritima]|uniref:DinB family protein n=1 Tax=Fulvivirga maritima TaxID=2904247 RepID=UPI001F33E31F|nr:DinB family protein [Fulvivirga maritima]UII24451.1 DinB family protein [Fulvivirga maritima]
MNNQIESLIEQVSSLLKGGNAHVTLERAVADLPADYRGKRPDGLPYSVWELVEHMRLAQADILDFSTNANYETWNWPDDYWPADEAPASEEEWQNSLTQIKEDRDKYIALISDPKADLYAPFEHGDGQNLLREALLIADHNSYHVGQIIVVRRLLGQWN